MAFSSRASISQPVDPLSETLSTLDVQTARCTRLEAGGDWALAFSKIRGLKFVAVISGACSILLPDGIPRLLGPGDTFLLSNTRYIVASDPRLVAAQGGPLFEDRDIVRLGDGSTVMLGGGFTFEGSGADLLLESLPPFMMIHAGDPVAAVLQSTLDLLDVELCHTHIGRSLMISRLADILVVQILRAFVATNGATVTGWLGGLADPRIGGAIARMHGDVGRQWSLDALAREAGMSRSAFALRFRRQIGLAPLAYLRRWRMALARRSLREDRGSVAVLATSLGYRSESAFGHAYKRAFGTAPGRDSLRSKNRDAGTP